MAYLDMTNSSHQCPSGLRQRTDSGVRSCAAYSDSPTCSSVLYELYGIRYSMVCGKIIGYQSRTTSEFQTHSSARGSGVDSNYVDGVSLTHGRSPRTHIWTFAAEACPSTGQPAFVGNHYFGDFARPYDPINLSSPLWDGINCRLNNPPWFHRQLPQPTADDIEMRVCRDQDRRDEDVAVKVIEIYVK